MKIALDAGHGGKDIGTKLQRYREKEITLSVVRQLEAAMKADGHHVPILTRVLDEDVLLIERLRIADGEGADALLSVHIYADPNHDSPETFVSGAEVWVNPGQQRNRRLGNLIHESVLHSFEGYPWKGVRESEQLDILQAASMPAALVELGFIDSRHEAEFLSRPAVQRRLALCLLAALDAYAEHP